MISQTKQDSATPARGSVIFCEMASYGRVEFYLVAQKVSDNMGTATITQYKLIYYKAEGKHEEAQPYKSNSQTNSTASSSEKTPLPLRALAQLTY
jgi:hypothetical protein